MLSLRELRRAVAVLDAERTGARLERVVQRDEELVLVLGGGGERKAGDKLALVLSCRPGHARLSARGAPGPAPPTPPAFASYLRAHLEGGRLRGASIRHEDRQAALRFETAEGRFELLLSILGPRSNVYLLGEGERLILALRPLADTRTELARGEPFRDPETRPPKEGEDRFEGVSDAELLLAIEHHYAERAADEKSDERARRIAQALRKSRAGLARKHKKLEAEVAEGARAAEYERLGELLKGVLGSVRPGAESVSANDYATGEAVEIPLDPTLSAASNLERYFKRHRKAERQALRAGQELGVLAERLEALDALAAECEAIGPDDADALDAFAARPEVARLIERYFPDKRPPPPKETRKLGGKEIPKRLQPKRYRTRDGLEVWVGKSDAANDFLTTRLARGKDLFFHLEHSPGSHVILRTEGREDPPQESILDACELAVHFSKQKNATRAGVHVAAIKDVSKPKGAKPGLVYVHRGRTVSLRRDPKRLERVLGARLDD